MACILLLEGAIEMTIEHPCFKVMKILAIAGSILCSTLFIISLVVNNAEVRATEKVVLVTKYVTATAYNSLPEQTDSTPWITSSGTRCRPGVVACNFLPPGTQLWLKGYGKTTFRVEDRMNRRFNDRIDIWFANYNDAIKFGKRTVKIAYFERQPI